MMCGRDHIELLQRETFGFVKQAIATVPESWNHWTTIHSIWTEGTGCAGYI